MVESGFLRHVFGAVPCSAANEAGGRCVRCVLNPSLQDSRCLTVRSYAYTLQGNQVLRARHRAR